jgi:hypothetical protein
MIEPSDASPAGRRTTGRFWRFIPVAALIAFAVLALPALLMPHCIVAGTLIDTPSGPRAIETLASGDEVWTRGRALGRVVATHPSWALEHLEIVMDDGRVLRATAEHPVATGAGWTRAGSLRVGEGIVSIRVVRGPVRVYDLEVEPDPTFFAGGVLVHNKTPAERNGSIVLKMIATAEADLRSNDHDHNGVNDFWVADVRGLWAILGQDDQPVKLIEPTVAAADLVPRPNAGGTRYDPMTGHEPGARWGQYFFAALRCFEDDGGRRVAYDDGTGRHPTKFGFVAVPAAGSRARTTFIMNEECTIWRKRLDGAIVDTFPRDPAREGWVKVD